MALVRVNFSIDDSTWPKLHIAGEFVGSTGERTAFDDKKQYDLAYSQFENLLHNQLRRAVQELLERRKSQL